MVRALQLKYLPPEKVRVRRKERNEDGEGSLVAEARLDDSYDSLREVGVDPEAGREYCQGDEGLYRSLLGEYAQGSPERVRELERCLDDRDWKGYAIVVHALKSSSKTIGATELADLAARLEEAADEGRGKDVLAGHHAMLERHTAVVDAIWTAMPEEQAFDAAEGDVLEFFPDDEDAILEFMPED